MERLAARQADAVDAAARQWRPWHRTPAPWADPDEIAIEPEEGEAEAERTRWRGRGSKKNRKRPRDKGRGLDHPAGGGAPAPRQRPMPFFAPGAGDKAVAIQSFVRDALPELVGAAVEAGEARLEEGLAPLKKDCEELLGMVPRNVLPGAFGSLPLGEAAMGAPPAGAAEVGAWVARVTGRVYTAAAPKLLVLDVNGLLIERFRAEADLPQRKEDARVGRFRIFFRPHLVEFMEFCMRHFAVGVWSSMVGHNLEAVIDAAMPGCRERLAFIWDQSRCTRTEEQGDKPGKPIFLKELSLLWDSGELGGLYGPRSTLLIDDDVYKARQNPPHTAIHPAAYLASNDGDGELGEGGGLRVYLQGLVEAVNVPGYVATHQYA